MDDFLIKFFPDVYVNKHKVRENNYCKYNNPYLQLFTSSLYLAAIVASFVASVTCKTLGRKPTMQAASVFFLIGAILNTTAKDLAMLIVGRLCLGAGVGFGNQVRTYLLFIIINPKFQYYCKDFYLICTSGKHSLNNYIRCINIPTTIIV